MDLINYPGTYPSSTQGIPNTTAHNNAVWTQNATAAPSTLINPQDYNYNYNLTWPNLNNVYTFTKETLDRVIEEFKTGKYTQKYVEVYLEFMFLNALLDNLEYLGYKNRLHEELK